MCLWSYLMMVLQLLSVSHLGQDFLYWLAFHPFWCKWKLRKLFTSQSTCSFRIVCTAPFWKHHVFIFASYLIIFQQGQLVSQFPVKAANAVLIDIKIFASNHKLRWHCIQSEKSKLGSEKRWKMTHSFECLLQHWLGRNFRFFFVIKYMLSGRIDSNFHRTVNWHSISL